MQKYQIQSGNVHLQIFASRTQSNEVLLFLHGGLGSGAWPLIMQKAIQQLAKEFHCVFFDQRGCGLSSYSLKEGITKEDMIEDIHNVVIDIKKQLHNERIILFGDSFGGYFALLCLEQYPELFDGMILCSPVLLLGSEDEYLLFKLIKEHYLKNGNRELQKLMEILKEESPEVFFTNTYVRQYVYSNKNNSQALCFIAAISNWLFQTPCIDALRKATIPTLILKGKEDLVSSEEHILNVLVQLQNPFLIYESFPECGHAIYEDQPEEFIDRVRRFLKEEFACA